MGGSGSSGKHSSGGAGSGRVGRDACDLTFRTNLFGPVPQVVATLRVGDILDIVLLSQNQPPAVGVYTRSAPIQQAGTIAGVRQLPDLINCMQDGHNYEARITQLADSAVTIDVMRSTSS